jgi:hypothetical protein
MQLSQACVFLIAYQARIDPAVGRFSKTMQGLDYQVSPYQHSSL